MKRFIIASLLCTLYMVSSSESFAMRWSTKECSAEMQEPDYVVQRCNEYWDRAVSLMEEGKEIEALQVMTEMREWGHSLDEAGKKVFNDTLVKLLNGGVATQISAKRQQAIKEHIYSYKERLEEADRTNNLIEFRAIRIELNEWFPELSSDAEMAYAAEVFQEMMDEIAK